MKVQFELTAEDLGQVQTVYWARIRKRAGLTFGLVGGGLVLLSIVTSNPFGGVFYGGSMAALYLAMKKHGAKISKDLFGQPLTFETTGTGFALTKLDGRKDYPWILCQAWRENEAIALLSLKATEGDFLLPLPRRAFSEDEWDELRELWQASRP